jgi:hypothetical protein
MSPGKIVQFQVISNDDSGGTLLLVLTDDGRLFGRIWKGMKPSEWEEEDTSGIRKIYQTRRMTE